MLVVSVSAEGRGSAAAAVVLSFAACAAPDPQAVLQASDVETHWALDSPVGSTQYMAPVVRFRVRNKGDQPLRSVQAMAVFRRKGESQTWGSDWRRVTGRAPLAPGPSELVVLKSDARYYSDGPVEGMFKHKLFRDATVQVFLKVGSSPWSKFAEADVERRLGAKSVESGGS